MNKLIKSMVSKIKQCSGIEEVVYLEGLLSVKKDGILYKLGFECIHKGEVARDLMSDTWEDLAFRKFNDRIGALEEWDKNLFICKGRVMKLDWNTTWVNYEGSDLYEEVKKQVKSLVYCSYSGDSDTYYCEGYDYLSLKSDEGQVLKLEIFMNDKGNRVREVKVR